MRSVLSGFVSATFAWAAYGTANPAHGVQFPAEHRGALAVLEVLPLELQIFGPLLGAGACVVGLLSSRRWWARIGWGLGVVGGYLLFAWGVNSVLG